MTDATFVRWAQDGLVWLPLRGMGYLRVEANPYDAEYFARYEAYADTEMGRALNAARLELVERYASSVTVIDIGIGCGQFVESRPHARGYDINPVGVAWLQARGWFRDPRADPADALTFWDSLEHINNAAAFVASAREWVFVSLPIVPGNGPPRPEWKHYRPDEHCWYWTRSGFIEWMREQGFRCVEHNLMETMLGREDIGSFAFRRRDA